jgi:hypothetical protein
MQTARNEDLSLVQETSENSNLIMRRGQARRVNELVNKQWAGVPAEIMTPSLFDPWFPQVQNSSNDFMFGFLGKSGS